MPGRLFQSATRLRLSGLSSGKLPRIAKRVGDFWPPASATPRELGSQPGGWSSAASTPPASISFRQSSADQAGIWRCAAFVGSPCCHRWICASTISMVSLLFSCHCERSEAISVQLHSVRRDCFVVALLATTTRLVLALHALGAGRDIVECEGH